MKGDFSRSSFDPRKHYRGVRLQQGRVQLDADWNEQADILLHLIEAQLDDLLGPSATAAAAPGFAITLVEPPEEPADQAQADQPEGPNTPARALPDFQIGAGRYYVDGILCENEAPVLYSRQPDYPAAASRLQEPADCDRVLVYLDVWERHITAAEDPTIREIALGGPDTATRVKTVWQVKLLPLAGDPADDQGWRDRGALRSLADWQAFVSQAGKNGRLSARWDRTTGAVLENRLYRAEIHTVTQDQVTFKWSRENGSVVFPITAVPQEKGEGTLLVTVDDLERDPYQLSENDWVEIADDVTVLNGRPLPLCQVKELDRPNARVTLHAEQTQIDQILAEIGARELRHPLLRRWESAQGSEEGVTTVEAEKWLPLENGIQVRFSSASGYHVGDYWLIPARTHLDEGIEWPQKDDQPQSRPRHGIVHRYASLALLQFQNGGWSILPEGATEPRGLPQIEGATEFGSLPQITANVIGMQAGLESVLQDVQRIRETVDELVEQQSRIQAHIYQDFPSTRGLEKGDVVAFLPATPTDPDPVDHVTRASKRNERLVVGVVAEVMDEQRCRVALYGRVCCKVIGDVQPGDLLVPSRAPGRAQKAGWYVRPGTILGKALSGTSPDKDKRTGTVDVLVTLG
ncbi:MAG: hypothetical protein JSV36_05915 [Anaerolineae bacterium]|nr:MAG: hypothetical protein JSV36_05915 [Anaerolineae bacterium]